MRSVLYQSTWQEFLFVCKLRGKLRLWQRSPFGGQESTLRPLRNMLLLSFFLLHFSLAQSSFNIVHEEKLKVGPYNVTVGFSRWPVQADRSLDIIFSVEGGINDKRGTVTLVTATPQTFNRQRRSHEAWPLARHPSQRDSWGLDVFAFPTEGQWEFQFVIDGSQGQGEGSLAVVLLGPPVFLPRTVTSLIALLPLILLLVIITLAWRRDKPCQQADTWSWS
jgi:hypothetical protein